MECLKSEKMYKIKRSYKEVSKHFLNRGRVFRGNTHFPCFLKFVFLEPQWKGNSYCYKNVINNTVPVLYRWGIWLEPFSCNCFFNSNNLQASQRINGNPFPLSFMSRYSFKSIFICCLIWFRIPLFNLQIVLYFLVLISNPQQLDCDPTNPLTLYSRASE